MELTSNQKGAIAEAAITKRAVELGVEVYRPVMEGGRYDLIFAVDRWLLRVQCKWAQIYRDVLVVRCFTSRRTKTGLVRRLYTPDEVDVFAAYCADLDACFLIPFESVGMSPVIHLRVARAKNNQRRGVRMAADFDFAARLRQVIKGP